MAENSRVDDGAGAGVVFPRHRTPTGWRDAVDRAAGDEAASYREPHTQTITPDDREIAKFSHSQFVAHLDREMRYGQQGELVIALAVPYEFAYLAEPLRTAFGLPLSVDIQLWEPYKKARQ